jgi:VanZ family protein
MGLLMRYIPIVLVLYWAGIFILTHIPVQNLGGPKVNDKIAHFVAYAGLATLLYLAFWLRWPRLRAAGWAVIGICMVYGAADELLQIPVGRSAELADWIADTAGAVTAVTVLASVRWYMNVRAARTEAAIASPAAAR